MKAIGLTGQLNLESIFLDVDATDRMSLIREVSARMVDHKEVIDATQLAEDAITREKELSTGIDRGIAMPHARTDAVSSLICAFVRPKQPVDFLSEDGKPCDLIFFSAVPRKCVDQYLFFTAAIVRKLHQQQVLDSLRNAKNRREVLTALGI